MMTKRYILRLDDACQTMDSAKWERIENMCDRFNIQPIVAVVPNNKDHKLMKNKIDVDFWNKVRDWQNRDWSIALHGYDHVYISHSSGLVPFNNKSEFSGVDFNTQLKKIKNGVNIFKKEGISARIWVAPSHTFDQNTLKALKMESEIEFISDGISFRPFQKYNFKWIPQTIWRARKMPFGLWTICIHPNEMTSMEFHKLEGFIQKNAKDFVSINELKYKKWSTLDSIFTYFYWIIRRVLR